MGQFADDANAVKCCDLFPGALRHQIIVQREINTPDAAGGNSLAWQNVSTIRAYIKPVSGSERLHSQRLEARTSHRIFIRYRTDIRTDDRIVYQNRPMQIRALINLEEMNRWIEIHAEEGVAT